MHLRGSINVNGNGERGGDTTQPLPLLLALLDHAPAVVGAAAPPHTELLRAFGTCARASRAGAWVQRARARHCIEGLKPTLQNGGQRLQAFNAESSIYNSSIVSAKLRICQVQGGNSGVWYWYM